MQGWKEPSKEGTQEELAGREHLEMRGAECVGGGGMESILSDRCELRSQAPGRAKHTLESERLNPAPLIYLAQR